MAAEAPVEARHTRLISRPGLIVSSRKGGWAMGEVTGFLVCTARRRQQGGDRAGNDFLRTECVAGVQDMRFQQRMPEALHWRGIRENHRLLSMGNDKYDAITGGGIEVGERVEVLDDLMLAGAKIAAGSFTGGSMSTYQALAQGKGRGLA